MLSAELIYTLMPNLFEGTAADTENSNSVVSAATSDKLYIFGFSRRWIKCTVFKTGLFQLKLVKNFEFLVIKKVRLTGFFANYKCNHCCESGYFGPF